MVSFLRFCLSPPQRVGQQLLPICALCIELAERFTYSPERKRIFLGLLNFREAIRLAGLTQGFQWIDGSFLEDCARIRGRAPNDIDLVIFFERPQAVSDSESWKKFADFHKDLFLNSKAKYCCDAYFVDLSDQRRLLYRALIIGFVSFYINERLLSGKVCFRSLY